MPAIYNMITNLNFCCLLSKKGLKVPKSVEYGPQYLKPFVGSPKVND